MHFEAGGGVPRKIWFDNQKVVVDHDRSAFGHVVFNETFAAYARDANFIPIACRPFRPQTKGKVESLANLVDRLMVYDHEIEDAEDFIEVVKRFSHDINFEKSQAIDRKPVELWEKEKEYLNDFNGELLDSYSEEPIKRKVNQESMVVFNRCKYSLHPRYIGKYVVLKTDAKKLYIYYKGNVVQEHDISNKRFNYKVEDMEAILRSDVYRDCSDEVIQEYIEKNIKQFKELE